MSERLETFAFAARVPKMLRDKLGYLSWENPAPSDAIPLV